MKKLCTGDYIAITGWCAIGINWIAWFLLKYDELYFWIGLFIIVVINALIQIVNHIFEIKKMENETKKLSVLR